MAWAVQAMTETFSKLEPVPDVAIIDYGMGNLRSVLKAWEAAGARCRLVTNCDNVGRPDALVFPGQGAIVDTMILLRESGLDTLICNWIADDRPFFGICLGLQALFEHSEEGDTSCLGILKGRVRRFPFSRESGYKIPHMGWNRVCLADCPPNLAGRDPHFYFVHSYYADPEDERVVWGRTEYGGLDFCSAVSFGNCVATQFHPEKSQRDGLLLYRWFLERLQKA